MQYNTRKIFFEKNAEKALSIQEKSLFLHTFSEEGRAVKRSRMFFHIMPV